jgi:hypothetical protein
LRDKQIPARQDGHGNRRNHRHPFPFPQKPLLANARVGFLDSEPEPLNPFGVLHRLSISQRARHSLVKSVHRDARGPHPDAVSSTPIDHRKQGSVLAERGSDARCRLGRIARSAREVGNEHGVFVVIAELAPVGSPECVHADPVGRRSHPERMTQTQRLPSAVFEPPFPPDVTVYLAG